MEEIAPKKGDLPVKKFLDKMYYFGAKNINYGALQNIISPKKKVSITVPLQQMTSFSVQMETILKE